MIALRLVFLTKSFKLYNMDNIENNNGKHPQSEDYFEFHYKYVHPTDDVLSLLHEVPCKDLTPLESVFVKWLVDCGSPTLALSKLIDPALPFDTAKYSAERLISRPTVQAEIRRIRQTFPYARLYKSDYSLGVLHEEVQYLRQRNRKHRYERGKSFNPTRYMGNKSINQEELAEIETLLKVLETLRQYVVTVTPLTGSTDAQPSTESDNANGGIDGIIAQAKQLIENAAIRASEHNGQPVKTDAP